MVKLQIGENTVTLSAKEENLFFELLDTNYDTIRNSPTFNAIYNWLKEDGRNTSQDKLKEIADPWSDDKLNQIYNYVDKKQPQEEVQYKNLREILTKLLTDNNEEGYYVAL